MGVNIALFHLEVFTVEFDELQLPVQPNISVHMPLLSLNRFIWGITLSSEEDTIYGF